MDYASILHSTVEPPPPGYPPRLPGGHATPVYTVDGPDLPSYVNRRNWVLEQKAARAAPPVLKGYYHELARLALERGPVHTGLIRAVLAYIDARHDCSDFLLLGITRILFQFADSPLISGGLLDACLRTALAFKYHPSEPGQDSMCTWTENHAIMFATCDYLHSSRYRQQVFGNTGETGRDRVERARHRVKRWLTMRFKTGFSEWLSNVYLDEDIMALLNLVDFAPDEEIAGAARAVLDLVCVELASCSFHGTLATSHGRSYSVEKRHPDQESIADTLYLLFGEGGLTERDNMSAIGLALSAYRCPDTITAIAGGGSRRTTTLTCGIRIRDARSWGVVHNTEEGMFELLTLEAYAHPRTIRHFVRLLSKYRWWQNEFFKPFARFRGLLRPLTRLRLAGLLATIVQRDVTRNVRERVTVVTARSPHYQISCAQDWRPGFGGDQQHIWQVSLGRRAVAFTTHPGSFGEGSVGFWTGSGVLPRAMLVGRCVVILYRLHTSPGLYHTNRLMFTHAWFPVAEFDEVTERGSWVFARLGDGYLGLRCPQAPRWYHFRESPDPGTGPGRNLDEDPSAPAVLGDDPAPNEVRCAGRRAVWICEVGSRSEDGEFGAFCEQRLAAAIRTTTGFFGPGVEYDSPSSGRIHMSWGGQITTDAVPGGGRELWRISNANVRMPVGAESCAVQTGDSAYEIRYPGEALA